jgi:DnaJ-domain-containing protein 1
MKRVAAVVENHFMYKNPFEFFGLTISIYVHDVTLNERYQETMKSLHPDQFSGEDAFMKKSAEQIAAYASNAYQTLKSPLKCMDAAIEAKGWPLPSEATTSDSILLMEMIELQDMAKSGQDLRPFYNDALVQFEKSLQEDLEIKALSSYSRVKFLARLLGYI